MNVLFITIAWPSCGERNLYSDLMDEFANRGHRVYVAAGTDRIISDDQRINMKERITVVYFSSGKIRKTSPVRKAISLLTLGQKFNRMINKYFIKVNFDLLLSHTPPITLSSLIRKLKKTHKIPFYLLLKDIWPQGSVDNEILHKFSIPWFYFRFHEIRMYKIADYIGCMSPMGVKYILSKNKFLKPDKIEVCPNTIKPTYLFKVSDPVLLRKKFNIPINTCVFIFSGNLGKGHGLGFLAEAIKRLADYPEAFFLIGGSGTHFHFLENSFKDYHSKNVLLYQWLPAEDFKLILQTSDVGLILLDKCYTVPQFPSRLLSYLDYSKPVLCAINQGTDIGSIVEEANCGKTLIHGDMDSFIEAVRFFSENPEKRIQMGKNARKLLENEYTTAHGYEIIMNHFKPVVNG